MWAFNLGILVILENYCNICDCKRLWLDFIQKTEDLLSYKPILNSDASVIDSVCSSKLFWSTYLLNYVKV